MVIKISEHSKQILRNSSITPILVTPKMSNAEYDELKYIVEYIGGHWKERYKGFVFDDSVGGIKDKVEYILDSNEIRLPDTKIFRIKNQFYPTPDWLARKMVGVADIHPGERVLEPSAGRGSILQYIALKTKNYYAVEYNRDNGEYLRYLGYRVNITSFERYSQRVSDDKKFDKIVMNPPFSNELDIRHTVLAYNILKQGGTLVGLMAENSIYYDRPITHRFNTFIEETNAHIVEVPHGSFKESGTNVDVIMVIIHKKTNNTFQL